MYPLCTESACFDSFAGAPSSSAKSKLGPEVRTRAGETQTTEGERKGDRRQSERERARGTFQKDRAAETFPPARPSRTARVESIDRPPGEKKKQVSTERASIATRRRGRRPRGRGDPHGGATGARYDHDAHADARSRPPGRSRRRAGPGAPGPERGAADALFRRPHAARLGRQSTSARRGRAVRPRARAHRGWRGRLP